MKIRDIKRKHGFTLLGMTIAVGIATLLSALSINGIMQVRMNVNEAGAVRTLRALHSALASYRAVNSRYPQSLNTLCSERPPYIDSTLAEGDKYGYNFELIGSDNNFLLIATPKQFGITGRKIFYLYEDGTISEVNWGASVGILNIRETDAVKALLALHSEFRKNKATEGRYPNSLRNLISRNPYLNSMLSRLAYDFEILDVNNGTFQLVATPTGSSDKTFYIDQTGTISARREEGGGGGGLKERMGPE